MFAPICGEIFTLSFEIMLILDWTSPLNSIFSQSLLTFAFQIRPFNLFSLQK